MGAADPFLMGPDYEPAAGIRRFLSRHARRSSGCSPSQDMLALVEEAGIAAVRAKSVALTAYALELADDLLAPARRGARLARATPSAGVATSRSPTRGCVR